MPAERPHPPDDHPAGAPADDRAPAADNAHGRSGPVPDGSGPLGGASIETGTESEAGAAPDAGRDSGDSTAGAGPARGTPRAHRDPIHDSAPGLPRLVEILRRLRDPATGCPWDIEQDFASIAPYTIEEAHEVADAIAQGDMAALEGELGDLLLQVVYHAQMGAEAGAFDFDSVARRVAAKMIDRHPHVFGNGSRDKTAAQQTADWEAIKARERADRAAGGVLDDVALGLPALTRAVKLQGRAARVGFDWPDAGQVLAKIAEEAGELAEARDRLTPADIADEMGDLLFALANLARHLGIDPEAALRGTNAKFTRRFRQIEAALALRGKTPLTSDLAEMDALWNAAKQRERGPGDGG